MSWENDRAHGEVVGYGSLEQDLANREAELFVALGALKPFADAYVAALDEGATAMDHGCDHPSNHDDAMWEVPIRDLRMARAATVYDQGITPTGVWREWLTERNEAFLAALELENTLKERDKRIADLLFVILKCREDERMQQGGREDYNLRLLDAALAGEDVHNV